MFNKSKKFTKLNILRDLTLNFLFRITLPFDSSVCSCTPRKERKKGFQWAGICRGQCRFLSPQTIKEVIKVARSLCLSSLTEFFNSKQRKFSNLCSNINDLKSSTWWLICELTRLMFVGFWLNDHESCCGKALQMFASSIYCWSFSWSFWILHGSGKLLMVWNFVIGFHAEAFTIFLVHWYLLWLTHVTKLIIVRLWQKSHADEFTRETLTNFGQKW